MAIAKAAMKALGALMALSVLMPDSRFRAMAHPQAEEQKPISDPTADEFDDSIWTTSPLYERAISLMKESPLIDTHIDLPQVLRSLGTYQKHPNLGNIYLPPLSHR